MTTPAVVWLVRDPGGGLYSVLAIYPTEQQAKAFTARINRRLVIEKWTVPGPE